MVKNIIVKVRRYKIELKKLLRHNTKEYYSEIMQGTVYSNLTPEEIIAIKNEINRINKTIQQYDKFRKIK